VGPRAILDVVVRKKIPGPCRESKPRTPIFQSVAQRYTGPFVFMMFLITHRNKFNFTFNFYLIFGSRNAIFEDLWEKNIRKGIEVCPLMVI
jgi:hypothetical protein